MNVISIYHKYIGLLHGMVSPVSLVFFGPPIRLFWRLDPRHVCWWKTWNAQAQRARIGSLDEVGIKYIRISYLHLTPFMEKWNCGCAPAAFTHPFVLANSGAPGRDSTLQKPGILTADRAILSRLFDGWGRRDTQRLVQQKKSEIF